MLTIGHIKRNLGRNLKDESEKFCNVGARKNLNSYVNPPCSAPTTRPPQIKVLYVAGGEVTRTGSQLVTSRAETGSRLTRGPVPSSISFLWSCILALNSYFYSCHWELGNNEDPRKCSNSWGYWRQEAISTSQAGGAAKLA